MGIDKFCCVDKLTAPITLITFSIAIVAHGALTTHESISQEAFTLLAVLLIDNLFESVALSNDVIENVLSNLSLLGCAGATKTIEITIKPIIDFLVDRMVVITNLLASFAFLHRLGLCGSAVLVSTAHVDGIMAGKTRIPCKDISRKHTADNVSKVGHIVDVGER